MNRRDFLKGSLAAGALAAGSGCATSMLRTSSPGNGEPFLAALSETSVAVSWAVGGLATGGVEIADNAQMRNARFVKAGEGPMAALDSLALMVRVTGLRPATRYWYRTVTDEIVSNRNSLFADLRRGARVKGKVYSFTTSGAAAESRFGVLSDTHAEWGSFAFTARRFRELRFPVAVWAGDALNCTEERRTAVNTFLAPDVPTKDYAAETPILYLPGNHDYQGEYAPHLDEVMPCRALSERGVEYAALKWNFAVRQGEIALIGLDTGEGFCDDDARLCGLAAFSDYRRLQTEWLEAALSRPEIAAAPFAVAFCHIPLYDPRPDANGCDRPLERGCAAWIRECNGQWGPVLDRHGVQLVITGHMHKHRWDDSTGFGWQQAVGGGPELGFGAGFVPDDSACPTIIEGVVENGRLAVRVHDAWRGGVLSERTFAPRT